MAMEFVTVYWRDMIKFFRLKAMLFASLIQPVLWLAIFGIGMSSSMDNSMGAMMIVPGNLDINYLTFMSAGIIAMTVLFTCLYSGIFLQLDKQFGLLKQILASPMKRSHILTGLTFGGVTKSILQVVIIMLFGAILGVKLFSGLGAIEIIVGILGIFLFVVLFAIGLMFLSLMISIEIESHEGVQAVITLLSLPLLFASNALYPMDSLATPIKALAAINPLTYFINGIRYFSFGSDALVSTNDMLLSLAFLVGFCVVMFLVTARAFKRAKVV